MNVIYIPRPVGCTLDYPRRSYLDACGCGHLSYEHAIFSWGITCLKCGAR